MRAEDREPVARGERATRSEMVGAGLDDIARAAAESRSRPWPPVVRPRPPAGDGGEAGEGAGGDLLAVGGADIARLGAIFDTSPVGIGITRQAGDTIVFANASLAAMRGVDKARLIGLDVSRLYADPAECRAVAAAFQRDGAVRDAEIAFRRADGSSFSALLTLGRVLFDGEPARFAWLYDISERKRVEWHLRHAHKMEAIGQLTGGIAHDFNNLLTIVIGNLQLLEGADGEDGEAPAAVRAALGAAIRGADLTRRLLAFARQQVLEPREVNLASVLAGMEDLLRRTLGEEIEIETVFATDLWPTRIDPVQLESAILNLALNARDAMPDGGRLTIGAANVALDADDAVSHGVDAGSYVLVEVSDSGIGMGAGEIERVFEPFFTTKGPDKGSGLGLSMVYGFVKQSGGHVKIYSEQGYGTTVKLYLPRGSKAAAAAPPADREAMPHGTETILVVEDDAGVRATAVKLLQGLGYRTLEAKDGPEALGLLAHGSGVDLLLTDVVMPGGIAGSALAHVARERAPHLKVLCMSGYTENAMARGGMIDEATAFVAKPFRKTELARKVRGALDGQGTVSSD